VANHMQRGRGLFHFIICKAGRLSNHMQRTCRSFREALHRAGGIRTRTPVTRERILSHQHYPSPRHTICSMSHPGVPIPSRSAPIAGLRFCQVRSTFEIDVLVD
jgi:hypothetical protein